MHLNLDDLLTASDLLGFLEEPFSHEEIDLVVQNLPTDKSPGLDGFNTDFIKKAWPIIKEDFYALCSAFYNGDICLQSINGSYITLILKDRLSTRDLLERKGMILQSHECVLCNQHSRETLEHLFLTCPFATQFWASLGLLVPVFQEHVQVVSSFRRQLNIPFFMEIIILGCWGIWMSRNDFIFRQLTPSVQGGQGILKKELALATHRAKNSIKEQFQEWINNHL